MIVLNRFILYSLIGKLFNLVDLLMIILFDLGLKSYSFIFFFYVEINFKYFSD